MARIISLRDQIKGLDAALKSKRTPPQLKSSLKKRKEALLRSLGNRKARKYDNRSLLERPLRM